MNHPADYGQRQARRRTWLVLLAAGVPSALLGAWRWHSAPRPSPAGPESDVCLVAPPSPYDPASGLPLTAARPIPPDARCPVCGMFPARAPEWAAQLIFDNGEAHFFDSPLSLFMYLQDLARYSPGRTQDNVATIYVSDSAAQPGTWLAADTAFYVHQSNARGPMRAGNLPAFATRAQAQAFTQRRGGQVLSYREINQPLIATLAAPTQHVGH